VLNLPVYRLPASGIWYIHTRIEGKQFKRSLGTRDKSIATLKAIELVRAMTIRKFEIDLKRGIYKAEPGEDTNAMLKVLEKLSEQPKQPKTLPPDPHGGTLEKGDAVAYSKPKHPQPRMTILQVVARFFLLKSNLSPATRISYEAAAKEFAQFFKNPDIKTLDISSLTKFQEHLATLGNSARTIDSKIARLRALFTFAIRQGLYKGSNPASGLNLMTKKQKNSGGYSIFDADEITQIFDSEYFKKQKIKDQNYYWGTLLALISGCRSSEITTLEIQHIKKNSAGIQYLTIRNSKTDAGIREVPISKTFFELGFDKFIEGKVGPIFKYQSRAGKGAGNAIGKKFSRHLEEIKITRDKLVFHSLRKFCNDFLLKNKVPIEARSQLIGHEIDSVNVQVYANKLSIEELAEIANPIQNKILQLVKINLPVA
jgi:integrase